MIRWIVGVPRLIDEDSVTYIKRATHRSEELATSYGSTDWSVLYRRLQIITTINGFSVSSNGRLGYKRCHVQEVGR